MTINIGQFSEELNNKVDIGYGNTSPKQPVTRQQISNCILEDPQNIKLELSNGILTLKAGSVVCVPNGFESDGTTPKFDEVTISSDISISITWAGNTTRVLFYWQDNNALNERQYNYSGSSVSPQQYSSWYDTTNNALKFTDDTGSTWYGSFSFPIAIITSTSNVITSIDQTFRSIGYIGSTVFVRKGLKVLIPNGRNDDGSLKNIEYTTSKAATKTSAYNTFNTINIRSDGTLNFSEKRFVFIQENVPSTTVGWWYRPSENQCYAYTSGGWAKTSIPWTWIAEMTSSNPISNFKPYTAVRALTTTDVHIIQTYVNGASGYNIWSNGYCEQWGIATHPQISANTGGTTTITFLKTFANTNYNFNVSIRTDASNTATLRNNYTSPSTGSIIVGWWTTNTLAGTGLFYWKASGYLAEGEY